MSSVVCLDENDCRDHVLGEVDAIGGQAGGPGAQDGHVVQKPLLGVELEGDGVSKLPTHGAHTWLFRCLEDGHDEQVELVLVNGLVVRTVGGTQDGVGHPVPHFLGDGLGSFFLGADDRLCVNWFL